MLVTSATTEHLCPPLGICGHVLQTLLVLLCILMLRMSQIRPVGGRGAGSRVVLHVVRLSFSKRPLSTVRCPGRSSPWGPGPAVHGEPHPLTVVRLLYAVGHGCPGPTTMLSSLYTYCAVYTHTRVYLCVCLRLLYIGNGEFTRFPSRARRSVSGFLPSLVGNPVVMAGSLASALSWFCHKYPQREPCVSWRSVAPLQTLLNTLLGKLSSGFARHRAHPPGLKLQSAPPAPASTTSQRMARRAGCSSLSLCPSTQMHPGPLPALGQHRQGLQEAPGPAGGQVGVPLPQSPTCSFWHLLSQEWAQGGFRWSLFLRTYARWREDIYLQGDESVLRGTNRG